MDSVDTRDESAVQGDKTEVAVVVFDSVAVGHEEDNRPASAAAEAQADEEEKQPAATLQTVSQQVFWQQISGAINLEAWYSHVAKPVEAPS